ncbi:hypothetical protein GCM10010909_33520 [Acidocella aquatica]|uniref:Uncharacterized protein n=1 Tax=Acidocella aquatica TaxID=1922313 RepID=A0ABQ6AB66_9PROT|nr:hypothetical protein [Acidocella aquatica]GLR68670.1 hypothetical protein GCM10010909_33520 [Acidocella aquatica]
MARRQLQRSGHWPHRLAIEVVTKAKSASDTEQEIVIKRNNRGHGLASAVLKKPDVMAARQKNMQAVMTLMMGDGPRQEFRAEEAGPYKRLWHMAQNDSRRDNFWVPEDRYPACRQCRVRCDKPTPNAARFSPRHLCRRQSRWQYDR